MAILMLNPNSTAAMTDAMTAAARAAAPGLAFEGWTSTEGPPAIQGAADGRAAEGPLLRLVARAGGAGGADGIIIGCFDDTALEAAAKMAPCPVLGIGQAGYHAAALRGWRFSVVTTLGVSVPILEANIARLGLQRYLARVRASEVPVLALEADPEAATAAILAEARRAVAEDRIDALILGCAGMVHVTEAVRAALPCPVIDPVESAARAMLWLTAGAISA